MTAPYRHAALPRCLVALLPPNPRRPTKTQKLGRLAIAVSQSGFYRGHRRLPRQVCQQRTKAVGRPAHGFPVVDATIAAAGAESGRSFLNAPVGNRGHTGNARCAARPLRRVAARYALPGFSTVQPCEVSCASTCSSVLASGSGSFFSLITVPDSYSSAFFAIHS